MFLATHGVIRNNSLAINARWTNCLHTWNLDNNLNDEIGGATLINNTATYGFGVINQCLSYNGTQDTKFPSNTFRPTVDFTINVWVKINSYAGGVGGVIDLDYATVGGFLATNGADKIRLLLPVASAYLNTSTLSTGVWYMISVVHVASTDYKMYVNGVLTDTVASALNYTWTTCTQYLGNLSTFGSYFLNGSVDIPSYWYETKDATFLLDMYNSGTGHQYPN